MGFDFSSIGASNGFVIFNGALLRPPLFPGTSADTSLAPREKGLHFVKGFFEEIMDIFHGGSHSILDFPPRVKAPHVYCSHLTTSTV